MSATAGGETDVPEELKAYMADWAVLLAVPAREHGELDRFLAEAGMQMFRVDNIMDALGRIEEAPRLDAMILDSRLLSFQARALLKAILKLRPDAGVVVLSDDPDTDAQGLETDVVFESPAVKPGRVAVALMEAKSLAAKRGR
jgi:DNA-binding NtrC family response regulator